MNLNKKIELIQSLGNCEEYFLLGKQTENNEFVYSCTEIQNALELAEILESIAKGIKDSIDEQTLGIDDAIQDLLDDFNIDTHEN